MLRAVTAVLSARCTFHSERFFFFFFCETELKSVPSGCRGKNVLNILFTAHFWTRTKIRSGFVATNADGGRLTVTRLSIYRPPPFPFPPVRRFCGRWWSTRPTAGRGGDCRSCAASKAPPTTTPTCGTPALASWRSSRPSHPARPPSASS